MATNVFWAGAAAIVAEVDTLTVSAVALNGVITAQMGAAPYVVSISYTCTGTDTTATAAAALLALIQAAVSLIPQFNDAQWSVTNNVITAVASTPGTPFTLAAASSGGATMTHAVTTANGSPSDVNNPNNWNRAGVAALPQSGDAMTVSDSTVPLLWNLDQLAAIQLASYTRWQSFTGTIGLPEFNPNGYSEYRPTYFQFGVQYGPTDMVLGVGNGNGPTRERYNVGGSLVALVVLNSGSAQDDYAIRFLSTHQGTTISVLNTSVGVAMLPGETAKMYQGTVDGGGTLDFGPGVTWSASSVLTVTNGTSTLFTAPGTLYVYNGSTATISQDAGTPAGTWPVVTVKDGSTLAWNAAGTIMTLLLSNASILDHSGDARAGTIVNSTVDGNCLINDPLNCISYTNATVINGLVSSGVFVVGAGRSFKVV